MGNCEMNLNRYPKYKPTGIPWHPELPEGWEVWRPYGSTLAATQHPRVRSVVGAGRFISWKRACLGKCEKHFSARAKKVVQRMFEDV